MLVAKLAQMGNFCLAKPDAMWPMAQMATTSGSLDSASIILLKVHYFGLLKVNNIV